MPSYNLCKIKDRKQYRADHEAILKATQDGSWPRDINDEMRWSAPTYSIHGRYWTEKEWAARMCEGCIAYVDGVEKRLAAGDPDLKGWEGWVEPKIVELET